MHGYVILEGQMMRCVNVGSMKVFVDIFFGVVFYAVFLIIAFDYYRKKTRRWGCNYDDNEGRKWK